MCVQSIIDERRDLLLSFFLRNECCTFFSYTFSYSLFVLIKPKCSSHTTFINLTFHIYFTKIDQKNSSLDNKSFLINAYKIFVKNGVDLN